MTNFLFSCTQSTVKLLAAAGGNVDLQTGSFRGNVTALMLAAAKGHLDVVKTLVELKASPDKKGEIEMVIVQILTGTIFDMIERGPEWYQSSHPLITLCMAHIFVK